MEILAGIIYVVFCLLAFFVVNKFIINPKQRVRNRSEETKQATTRERAEKNEQQSFSMGKVLTVLMLGMFFSLLNQTVINVALPVLINDLNVSTTTAQWLSTGFMLINGILIPISAYLIERFTYRRLFMSALFFFVVGSIICAVSGNFFFMMLGRSVQAVGAGILMPLGTNIFMTVFPAEKRGSAMGVMGVAMILAPAIGPTIAGYVIEYYDWHLIFYAMAIIGVVTLILANSWFHISRERKTPPLDFLGIITSSIGLGTLLYGFSEAGSSGWDDNKVVASLVIAVISLVLFVIRELTTEAPLLDLRVFKNFTFSYTLFINFVLTIALFGGMLLLPLYLQSIRGFTPVQSGLLMMPGSLIMGIMGAFTGKLYDKYGARPLAIFGILIMTVTTYEFTKLSLDTPYAFLVFVYAVRGFGMSFIMMPIMTEGYSKLPMKQISHGIATQNTIRQVSGSVGTAILITIMTRQTTFHLADYGNEITSTNSVIMNGVHQTSQYFMNTLHLPSQVADGLTIQMLYGQAAKLSAINGINDAFLVSTFLSIIAFGLSFFMSGRVKKDEQKKASKSHEGMEETMTA